MNKSTALLPILNLKKQQKNYGKNTQEALNAGFLWGYEGLINNIIKKISSRSKINYKIILTGGYANFFKKILSTKQLLIKMLQSKVLQKLLKNYWI